MYVIKWNVPQDSPGCQHTYWDGGRWVYGVSKAKVYPSLQSLPEAVGEEDRFRLQSSKSEIPYYGSSAAAIAVAIDDREIVFGEPSHTCTIDLQLVGVVDDAQLASALAKALPRTEGEQWAISHARVTVGDWAAYGVRCRRHERSRRHTMQVVSVDKTEPGLAPKPPSEERDTDPGYKFGASCDCKTDGECADGLLSDALARARGGNHKPGGNHNPQEPDEPEDQRTKMWDGPMPGIEERHRADAHPLAPHIHDPELKRLINKKLAP